MFDENEIRQLNEKQLAELIEYHNRKYWAEAEPEITDDQYDFLMRRLAELNPSHPLLSAVNAPVVASSWQSHSPRPHAFPRQSLLPR